MSVCASLCEHVHEIVDDLMSTMAPAEPLQAQPSLSCTPLSPRSPIQPTMSQGLSVSVFVCVCVCVRAGLCEHVDGCVNVCKRAV